MVTEMHCVDRSRNSVDGAVRYRHGKEENSTAKAWHRIGLDCDGKDGRGIVRCGNGRVWRGVEEQRNGMVMRRRAMAV